VKVGVVCVDSLAGYQTTYLYSPEEIDELSDRVRKAAEQIKLLFAFFNNHWQGYAPRNDASMMRALQLPYSELPLQVVLLEENEHTSDNYTFHRNVARQDP